ncbi:hypothetical protein [Corynebacterium durum]|uniref:hypothetical protein n=1 Tax=Corynebacterium durum TaxID=61592 RepID=UPI0028E3C3BF|nr:hypothetical protein [Corynebacterium durum]
MTHRKPPSRLANAVAGLGAQVFSSLNSFLIIIISARFLELGVHGHFVFGVALCQIVLSLVRALCGETVVVLSTRGDDTTDDAAFSSAIVASAVGGVVCLLTAIVWAEYRSALIATAFVGIPVCAMDVLRYCAIAEKRSELLLFSDFLVFVGTTVGLLVVGQVAASPSAFLAVWGVSCLLVSILLVWQLDIRPVSFRATLDWLTINFPRSSAFFAEAALGATAGVAILAVMAIVTDSEQVSIFRTALTIMGVTSLINNFMRSTVLRELSPDLLRNKTYVIRVFLGMTAVVTLVIVVFGLCIWLAPNSLTAAIFGANFVAIVPVLLPAIIHRVCASCSTIPTIFLRAQGITWQATRFRFVVVAIGIIVGPFGAYLGGAHGALIGDMITYLTLFVGLSALVMYTANKQDNAS